MSIIIQAGHESSSSTILMEMLYEHGLKKANYSKVENLSSIQVANALNEIIGQSENIPNNKLVEDLALDFLLANANQDNWGWEASSNLFSLPYWASWNINSRFILVFDHPQKLFSHLKPNEITEEKVNGIMRDWLTYHSAMLDFWKKNKDRCVLLEGVTAIKEIAKTKKLLELLSESSILKINERSSDYPTIEKLRSINYKKIASKPIVDEVIKKYPEVTSIFNTLITKADLSESDRIYKKKYIEKKSLLKMIVDIEKNFDAINVSFKEKEIERLEVIKELHSKEINLLVNQLCLIQEDSEFYFKEHSKRMKEEKLEFLKGSIGEEISDVSTQASYSKKDSKNKNLEENVVLKKSIHLIEEDLEYYFKMNSISLYKEAMYHGAPKLIKDSFSYKLGSVLVESGRNPKNISNIPYFLFMEYKHYKNNKNSESNNIPIEKYADADEAERVKKHLSYRLGRTITDSFKKSGSVVSLPLNIAKEIIIFNKDQ